MTATDTSRILNDATSQLDRVRGAPAPEAVTVDARSLAQLLAFAAEYGALITFYDLTDQAAGDWSAFFAADKAVADAMHAALDVDDIARQLEKLLEDIRDALDPHHHHHHHHHHRHHRHRHSLLLKLLTMLARLLGILDREGAIDGDGEAQMRQMATRNRTDDLADPMRKLDRHLQRNTIDQALGEADQEDEDAEARQGRHRHDDDHHHHHHHGRGWIERLLALIEDFIATLIAELRQGAASSLIALENSLAKGDHAPQAAVYNAFVMLLIECRRVLNSFPRRLVDFYYGKVLRQHGLPATPDNVFLTFTTAQGVDIASIPRGALFVAGEDANGDAINYAADIALEVTSSVVSEISVHRVTHAGKGHGIGNLVETGVLSGNVSFNPAKPSTMKPFPMFGEATPGIYGSLDLQRACLGFCVSSQTLMLAGGARTISLGLSVSRRSPTEMMPIISLVDQQALLKALSVGFAIHYSTAGGWMAVKDYSVTPTLPIACDDGTLVAITFSLPDDAPPLVALSTKPAQDAPAPSLPASAFPEPPDEPSVVCSLRLDGPAEDAAFAILATIQLDSIFVDVDVEGLADLSLVTPNGPADTTQNLALLGLPPAQYGAIDVYAPELFVKTVDALSVTVTWAGLPVTSAGFKGYYQNYIVNADGAISQTPLFDNTSFTVAWDVVNPGLWDVSGTPFCLFQTPPAADGPATINPEPAPAVPVLRQSVLTVPGVLPLSPPDFYNPTTSALSLVLVAPDYAFGNILYSSNLMAASSAQTAAATSNASGSSGGSAAQVANLGQVNATAPDKTYFQALATAVNGAISALTGDALATTQQAIVQSKASADQQAEWLKSLEQAIGGDPDIETTIWDRITGRAAPASDPVSVLNALTAWVDQYGPQMGSHAAPLINRAQVVLAAANGIASAHAAAVDQPVAVARPTMAAAVQQAQIAVLPPGLPNPPWLPMASALTVDYSASAVLSFATDVAVLLSPPPPSASTPPTAGIDLTFWHIGPFGTLSPPQAPGANTSGLLPHVDAHAALYIKLSEPVEQVALLFVLSAGPDGWWDDPPVMVWEQHVDQQWLPLTVYSDTTNGLKNSGIVTVAPQPGADPKKGPRLRVRAQGSAANAPIVQTVVANALTAHWAGPGGAIGLGKPLPANTIKKAVDPIAGIDTIVQPMQSFGGCPPIVGRDFQMWMAERLRHKGYGIDAWDYARIALETCPSLWQAAVVPAVDEKTGLTAPGRVWLVAVGGPDTPNVTDPTVPTVDLATLTQIGETLQGRISPFIDLAVTNPPYMRLRVRAEIDFTRDNTPAYWIDRLQGELVQWLSPWLPPATLGERPANYYTRRAVAEFIRKRPYVRGIDSIELIPAVGTSGVGWYYLTSALKDQHQLTAAPHIKAGKRLRLPAGVPVP